MSRKYWLSLGLGLGAAGGYAAYQIFWVNKHLHSADVRRTLAATSNEIHNGQTFSEHQEAEHYTVAHTIENGIERITYSPTKRRFKTPLLMLHGMWHGAWCWKFWQELFAGWGWESISFSLPGHGASPEQRPIRLCTLDYYLSFLKAEIERMPYTPVLMGHSMGGALTQWYLKYVGDNLPAAVLVAPWVSHNAWSTSLPAFLKADPLGCLLVSFDWSTTPFIRTPESTARLLISENALMTPEELQAKLGPESALITFQHSPPGWIPPVNIQTPMLWVAAEKDAVVTLDNQTLSAIHYLSDFIIIKDAAHNLMMEHNARQTAEQIHSWLVAQSIA